MPRLPDPRYAPDCAIEVDGRLVPARAGESVAVALMAAGDLVVARSAKYHRPRGAFCLAGSCHQCLARVGGVQNVRTCLAPCRDGLAVLSQNALPTARGDVLAAVDRVYPHGLDHHHLMTWTRLGNRVAVAASRQVAGVGRLPDRASPASPPSREAAFDAVVVGAGPAGLGAAEALARAGRRTLLVEAARALGGRLRCALAMPGDPPLAWAADVARAVAAAGGEVHARATAAGLWDAGEAHLALVRVEGRAGPPALLVARARAVVVATGSWALPPVFARNDLPGVFAARGLLAALAEDGAVPGRRTAVTGEGTEADAAAARLAAAGLEVVRVRDVEAARGGSRLSGLALAGGARVACDALAHAGPRAPASDLARARGAAVRLDAASGGWAVAASPAGATTVPGLFAAGEVAGAPSAAEAADAGRRAGEAAARA